MGYIFGASGIWNAVGISLVEVYDRVEKSVISVGKKAQKSYQMHYMNVKKSRKHSLEKQKEKKRGIESAFRDAKI